MSVEKKRSCVLSHRSHTGDEARRWCCVKYGTREWLGMEGPQISPIPALAMSREPSTGPDCSFQPGICAVLSCPEESQAADQE